MPGKIFYRQREKVKDGAQTPRFRVVAVADLNLKVYAEHLRRGELEELARSVDAELIALKGGDGKGKQKSGA